MMAITVEGTVVHRKTADEVGKTCRNSIPLPECSVKDVFSRTRWDEQILVWCTTKIFEW